MSKLSSFIDFFNYLPIDNKKDKNSSKELFYIMTSNKNGGATFNTQELEKVEEKNEEKEHFNTLLSMVWSKLHERFPSINAAFRFFDSNYD